MKYKKFILAILVIFLLASCIPGDGKATEEKAAGFFSGIWHGWIAPLSLIIQIFNSNIRIYEQVNIGWWYDFGFFIAIIGGFGSISFSRNKIKKRKKKKMHDDKD